MCACWCPRRWLHELLRSQTDWSFAFLRLPIPIKPSCSLEALHTRTNRLSSRPLLRGGLGRRVGAGGGARAWSLPQGTDGQTDGLSGRAAEGTAGSKGQEVASAGTAVGDLRGCCWEIKYGIVSNHLQCILDS